MTYYASNFSFAMGIVKIIKFIEQSFDVVEVLDAGSHRCVHVGHACGRDPSATSSIYLYASFVLLTQHKLEIV